MSADEWAALGERKTVLDQATLVERRLRDALARFAAAMIGPGTANVRKTVAWPRVERLLQEVGFDLEAAGGQDRTGEG